MSADTVPSSDNLRKRVEHVLELIRPAVQSDGGDIELVNITDDGVVQIRFHGECVGCPSSSMTLQHGVEKNLTARVPEVKSVVAVN
ncbi:MAG: NifU family protein [Planctomycetes bacterium]|nr:NifU family protein [Planctomycetota bacterium]